MKRYQFESLASDHDNQPDVVVDWTSEDECAGTPAEGVRREKME